MEKDRVEDSNNELDVGDARNRDQEDEIDTPHREELDDFRMRKRSRSGIDESKKMTPERIGSDAPPRRSSDRGRSKDRKLLYGILAFTFLIFISVIILFYNVNSLNKSIENSTSGLGSTQEATKKDDLSLKNLSMKYEDLNKKVAIMEEQMNALNKSLNYSINNNISSRKGAHVP